MKLKLFVTTALVLLLGAGIAEAQPGQRLQRHRIREGVRSGDLTRTETRSLVAGQRRLHRDVRRAKRDGVITRNERREIRRDKRMNNRAIYRKKHNRRHRI
ncbi:MAG TPA: hypothetical protein PLZ45_01685 [Ferruginibacter sp.]|nr:hypothetical protein [Chitinophagaceae bacterium]HRI23350.1 hypothetical protein [Ferruginibacter sp.]